MKKTGHVYKATASFKSKSKNDEEVRLSEHLRTTSKKISKKVKRDLSYSGQADLDNNLN